MSNLAFANIEDLIVIDENGLPQVDFSTATRDQLAAVTRITNKRREVYNGKGEHVATEEQSGFVLADKYRGLELLGRHVGLFKNEEQRVVVDVADRLLQSRERWLKVTKVEDLGDSDADE